MLVKQISVFLENKKGRLAKLTRVLGETGIDLIALSIADTTDYGILRCIVSDTDKALQVIKQAGMTASVTEVLAVAVPDEPGGLNRVMTLLDQEGISVEYLYSFVRTSCDDALILFRVEELDRAIQAIQKGGIRVLTQQDIDQM
ncbi:MAG: ACT domain-containing protein [Christensenellales bacterium]|jgi:hypothetical protein